MLTDWVAIKVDTNWGNSRKYKVRGLAFGDWLVHRIPKLRCEPERSPGHGFRVSHACGASLARLVDDLTFEDAAAIARELAARIPDFPFPKIETTEDAERLPINPWGYIVQAIVAEVLEDAS